MLSPETKQCLKDLLLYTAEREIAIEKHRQTLCRLKDFSPQGAFNKLTQQQPHLSCQEISDFLQANGYKEITPNDLDKLLTYYTTPATTTTTTTSSSVEKLPYAQFL